MDKPSWIPDEVFQYFSNGKREGSKIDLEVYDGLSRLLANNKACEKMWSSVKGKWCCIAEDDCLRLFIAIGFAYRDSLVGNDAKAERKRNQEIKKYSEILWNTLKHSELNAMFAYRGIIFTSLLKNLSHEAELLIKAYQPELEASSQRVIFIEKLWWAMIPALTKEPCKSAIARISRIILEDDLIDRDEVNSIIKRANKRRMK